MWPKCGHFYCGATQAVGLCEDRDRRRLTPFAHHLTLRSWDTATGKEQRAGTLPPVDIFGEMIWALHPDGELAVLASGRFDAPAQVSLYDFELSREVVRLTGHHGAITAMAVFRDGKRFATASRDTTALVWDLTAARVVGLWPLIGQDERAAKWMAAHFAEAAPLLIDRVASAASIERTFARLITDLGSDDRALVDRATQRLTSDTTSEFSLRLAAAGHPIAAGRQQAARILNAMTAASEDQIERITSLLGARDKSVTYADLKSLGPAAEATYRAAQERFRDKARLSRPVADPFGDAEYLARLLPPASIFRAIELLAGASAPEADRLLQELARDPAESQLAQAARKALARRSNP
jgi:WD40 repeat protein